MLLMIIVFTMTMFTLNAQMHKQEGNLTIYSEEGDKFFLFLNGECQNNIAQKNLRIEDLELPTYTIKIAFTDKRLEQLTNKQIQMQDVEGRFMEVTYRIKKDKKTGIPKLKLYAMEPAQNAMGWEPFLTTVRLIIFELLLSMSATDTSKRVELRSFWMTWK